jgi:hypothetical protein
MAAFENYSREAQDIEREIERKGFILGIDWNDDTQVRLLAREALACRNLDDPARCDTSDPHSRTKIELFGLAQLMLTVMRESADDGLLTHGGDAWKAFARALWAEDENENALKG